MMPDKQSNSKPSTASNRSKLSLRRKKGKGDENVVSQTKSSGLSKGGAQLGNHSCHKNSVKQEEHVTSPKESIAHQIPFETSSVVVGVTVQSSSAPISADNQSLVEIHSKDKAGDACDLNISPTISEHQDKHAQLLTNSLTGIPKLTDEEGMKVDDVPMGKTSFEVDDTAICNICTADISHLTMLDRLDHIEICTATSRNTSQKTTSTGTSVLDTKKLISKEPRANHVQFCDRDERMETLPFLELPISSLQSAATPVLLSDGAKKPSQKVFKDHLSKTEPAVSGRSKVDSQLQRTDGEDDDFNLPLSHSLSKLGVKRKKDFQEENYVDNLEEEQLQLALALSASIGTEQPVCFGEVEEIQPMSTTFKKPRRKQTKMAKRLKMSTVPPLLSITLEQAQSLLAQRAEEIVKSTGSQPLHDDELPSTPPFGNSDLASPAQSGINHNENSRASCQTGQEHHNRILSVCDFDEKSSATLVKQNVPGIGAQQLNTESDEIVQEEGVSLTEVAERKDPGIPSHQSQTVSLSGKEDVQQFQEQSSCPNHTSVSKIENSASLSSTNVQNFSYSTLWQVNSGEKHHIEEFYVPALASVIFPLRDINYLCKVSEKKPQVQTPPSSHSSWTNSGVPRLCSDLSSLVGSTLFSDVHISTSSGVDIPAHAVLLAVRCPALRKELMLSSHPMRLDFTDFKDSVVLDFLRVLYTGSLPPAANFGVIDLARKWSVDELLLTHNQDGLTATQEISVTPTTSLDSNTPSNLSVPKQTIEFPASDKVILKVDSPPIHQHGRIITLGEGTEIDQEDEGNVGVGVMEVMMGDSGKYINIPSPSCSPKEDSCDINPTPHPLETESLHQSLPRTPLYDSILGSPERETSLRRDRYSPPKSVTVVSEDSYGCSPKSSPQDSIACIQHCNTSCLSVVQDSITMSQGTSEESVGVHTRAVERLVISESDSDQSEVSGQLFDEHSPRADGSYSEHRLDSPPLFKYLKTPTKMPSVFSDSAMAPSAQTNKTSTLETPRDFQSSSGLCLSMPSEYCKLHTPLGTAGIRIESDDNITPMPSYHDMVTPALKAQCGRFGVKPLAKRKMIAKLQEIYEYTHPLVDSSGTIILPEQDPVKEKQPKIQTKQSQRKANAECPDTMAPGGTSQVMNELLVSSDLKVKIRDCISSDKDLYKDILIFKPIELSVIQSKLRESGLSVAKDKLINILDYLCVTFTSPRTQRGRVKLMTQ